MYIYRFRYSLWGGYLLKGQVVKSSSEEAIMKYSMHFPVRKAVRYNSNLEVASRI